MASPEFFGHLGLFVRRNFFDSPLCERLQAEIDAAACEKGRITRTGGDEVLDESQRRVLLAAHLERSAKSLVKERLRDLKPILEEHFKVSLTDFQPPAFLSYGEGAFYKHHRDASPGASDDIEKRRVSVVIFLNGQSAAPAANCYGGGQLTFYGLLDGEKWEECAFALDAEPGLLIAFRSGTFHEVRPVTHGRRFTIVAWFIDNPPGPRETCQSAQTAHEANVRAGQA